MLKVTKYEARPIETLWTAEVYLKRDYCSSSKKYRMKPKSAGMIHASIDQLRADENKT